MEYKCFRCGKDVVLLQVDDISRIFACESCDNDYQEIFWEDSDDY